MDQMLVLLTGIIISIMVSINGYLSDVTGVALSAVIIHVVGILFAYLICFIRKEPVFHKVSLPLWAYFGGAVGFLTTVFNNYAFLYMSMTAIVALGLLGQCIVSALIDAFGLFGLPKRKITIGTWIGLLVSFVGVAMMMNDAHGASLMAILLSLGAGITVVLTRTINASLAQKTTPMVGSLYNHMVGLPCCILFFLIMPKMQPHWSSLQPWMLLGGTLGVITVMLYNITVAKVSASRITLLAFIGQIFAGILLDIITGQPISSQLFLGGILVSAGLFAGMLIDRMFSVSMYNQGKN